MSSHKPEDDMDKPNFEFDDQAAGDIVLLSELADVLGGAEKASNFICAAETIRDIRLRFDELIDNSIVFLANHRRAGLLHDEFQAMSDEEFDQHFRTVRQDYLSRLIAESEVKTTVTMARLKVKGQEDHAYQLLQALGINKLDNEFELTERDEERAANILRTAKLMNYGYREFIGLNPGLLAFIDPAVAAQLKNRPIEDPGIRQRYAELRYEL